MSADATRKKIPLIMGCTAGGKSSLALELARRRGAAIVSVDSMKIYRRMDIGSAKPSAEAQAAVEHYMIDVVEPSESFSVGRYVEMAEGVISELQATQRPIILVGGTALYIKSLVAGLFDGPPADAGIRAELQAEAEQTSAQALHRRLSEVDPDTAGRVHPNDLKRIVRALEVHQITGRPISSFQQQWSGAGGESRYQLIALRRDKDDASRRINARVKRMVQAGLVDEVKGLLAEPGGLSDQAAQAIGYAEIIAHLNGTMELDEAVEKIKINTRRLAKNQRTWFRSFGDVHWLDVGEDDTAAAVADRVEPLIF